MQVPGEYSQGCPVWLPAVINLWQVLLWKLHCSSIPEVRFGFTGIVSAGLLLHTAPDCHQKPLSLAEIMNYFHLEKKSSEELGLWDLCPKTRCAGVAVNYSATHRCFRHSDVALP